MRKLLASVLALAAVGGSAAGALAAEGQTPPPPLPAPAAHQAEITRFEAVDQVAERRAQRADRVQEKRRERRAERRERKREQGNGASPALEAIAACESGGDPTAIGGGGMYRGKYQFSRETWAGVGGSGDPAEASEAEQDKRAAMLYARDGAGQWPVCGQ